MKFKKTVESVFQQLESFFINVSKRLLYLFCVKRVHMVYPLIFILAPNGPPLNIRTTSRSASSLSFAWDLPETSKQNGVITNCTACVSRSENGPCFQILITNERFWVVKNLKASTMYYIRVFASTKVGHGNYSESKGFFTSERKNTIYQRFLFDLRLPIVFTSYLAFLCSLLKKMCLKTAYQYLLNHFRK